MKILLIGSGGREHAIALKLVQSPKCKKLYIAPGNPGTSEIGENVAISDSDNEGLVKFAKDKQIDLTFVGPEGPLVRGLVDRFEEEGLVAIGPKKLAAQLEGSKKWAKELMIKFNIPTASSHFFYNFDSAVDYLQKHDQYPIVIKADGLAAGKGVTVSQNFEEAKSALEDALIKKVFKDAGSQVLIEDFLVGEEASVLAFTDGITVRPMISAQDHKAVFDGDKGPNTGGMGAYSPAPIVTPEVVQKVQAQILRPMIKGLKQMGITYKGVIYAGLMIHNGNPSVVEFNVRFGDPETQVVLPLLKTDLVDIFCAIQDNELNKLNIEWENKSSVCVVLASKGYPGNFEKGKVVSGAQNFKKGPDIQLIHAGTRRENGQLLTNGGRVFGIVAKAETLEAAIQTAYSAEKQVIFENKYCRSDIGFKALGSVRKF